MSKADVFKWAMVTVAIVAIWVVNPWLKTVAEDHSRALCLVQQSGRVEGNERARVQRESYQAVHDHSMKMAVREYKLGEDTMANEDVNFAALFMSYKARVHVLPSITC